jgi:RNA polymerase sigma-70 factor (ECF subfamily)
VGALVVLSGPSQSTRDLKLMAAVAARDAHAQTELVLRLAARVRRLTRLLCRAGGDADDAAQMALLEILRSASSFRTDTSLERWADRITSRVTFRLARRERQRRGLFRRWFAPGLALFGDGAIVSPGDDLSVHALLDRLSDERRTAFVLRHLAEYSIEEIAELTGAPPGTVKDRLVSARKQLRSWLRKDATIRHRGGAL